MRKKNDDIGNYASRIMRDGRYNKTNKSKAAKALRSLRKRNK